MVVIPVSRTNLDVIPTIAKASHCVLIIFLILRICLLQLYEVNNSTLKDYDEIEDVKKCIDS